MATDEDILARSLGAPVSPAVLYRPYRVGGSGPAVLFRDHALSDRIGFQYQSWEPAAAARDLLDQVRDRGRRFSEVTGGEVATVSVILDGENAWEYYEGGGRPFLRALYGALEAASDIQTVTMSEASAGPARPLASIFPGSWINADFYIWMGHRDDHRAWDQLSEAREMLDARSALVPAESRDRALEELLIAEGSDWFWWYGDDHSSDHDADFDDLFRRHIRNAYAALDVPIPEELFATNISTGAGPERLSPSGRLSLVLDGRDSSYLEWLGAASPSLTRPGGAMHEVAVPSLIAGVRVGLGQSGLCLRLDGDRVVSLVASNDVSLAIVVNGGDVRTVPIDRRWLAVDDRIEVEVPLNQLRARPGADIEFAVQVRDRSESLLESVPHGRFWTLRIAEAEEIIGDWPV